jgi:tetratricopeptide (TPR) repeat protein
MPPSPHFPIPGTHPLAALLEQRQRAAAARARLEPRDAAAWLELTALAIEAGAAEAARQLAAQALRLERRQPAVHYLAGRAARLAGELEAAVAHYRHALRLAPDYTDAWISLASAERARQDFDAALEALERAYALAPGRSEIRVNQGNLLADRGDWAEAVHAFRAALELAPGHPAARLGLARSLVHQNGFAEALPLLEGLEAEGIAPYTVQQLLGRCRWLLGDPAGARAALVRAWQAALADPAARPLVGQDLIVQCEDPEAGLEVLRPLLASAPDDPFLRQCELDILIHAPRPAEAAERLLPGIERGEENPELAFSALQLALRSPDAELARRCTDYALGHCSDGRHPEIALTAGISLLRLGDWARGLPLYERRLEAGALPGMAHRVLRLGRRWRGEALTGRRLLVWQEQGLGDTLQMLRFAAVLKARGVAELQWVANPALRRLLAAQPALDAVHGHVREARPYELHCPDMSLTALLAPTLADLPAPMGYLVAPPERTAAWQARLGPTDGRLRVALTWAGNPGLDADRFRSIPPADLAPLAEVTGVQWFNVQKGEPAAAFAGDPPFPTEDLRAELGDLAETAALYTCMDLVISVDSAPVHLAAALGRPTWLLNRAMSEYRWGLGREDSPWYPSLRLFNQRRPCQWRETLERVAQALAEAVAAHRARRLVEGDAVPAAASTDRA